jgi:hypothetical protein
MSVFVELALYFLGAWHSVLLHHLVGIQLLSVLGIEFFGIGPGNAVSD